MPPQRPSAGGESRERDSILSNSNKPQPVGIDIAFLHVPSQHLSQCLLVIIKLRFVTFNQYLGIVHLVCLIIDQYQAIFLFKPGVDDTLDQNQLVRVPVPHLAGRYSHHKLFLFIQLS